MFDGYTRDEVKAKLTILGKREEELEKDLVMLKREKFDLIIKEKKMNEEDKCLYARGSADNQYGPWPILNNQYQVLSLLGKGGFSAARCRNKTTSIGPRSRITQAYSSFASQVPWSRTSRKASGQSGVSWWVFFTSEVRPRK